MEDARPRGNPLKWRGGRSAWGAPLCCGSSEMSLHRLLAPPRGASPGAAGAPEILGGPNPQAADRRKGGALSREANTAMRSPPPAPGRTGLAGRLALSTRSSDGTASTFARFRAMHPGQPPSRPHLI